MIFQYLYTITLTFLNNFMYILFLFCLLYGLVHGFLKLSANNGITTFKRQPSNIIDFIING